MPGVIVQGEFVSGKSVRREVSRRTVYTQELAINGLEIHIPTEENPFCLLIIFYCFPSNVTCQHATHFDQRGHI